MKELVNCVALTPIHSLFAFATDNPLRMQIEDFVNDLPLTTNLKKGK
jgi:hypothetical protein